MKAIKYIIITLFCVLGLNACDNDSERIIYNSQNASSGTLSAIADKLTLLAKDAEKVAASFKWTQSDFGVDVAITYTLQADVKGKEFANPVTVGTVSIDHHKKEMTLECKTADLNKALNNCASKYNMNISQPIHFEFRLLSDFTSKERLHSNIISSTVQLYQTSIKLPDAMYIIASPFDWSWDKAASLTPVFGYAGANASPDAEKSMYWMVRYFNADDAIKFNYHKAWDGGEFGYSAVSDAAKTLA